MTVYPSRWSRPLTSFHPEASANAPWMSTAESRLDDYAACGMRAGLPILTMTGTTAERRFDRRESDAIRDHFRRHRDLLRRLGQRSADRSQPWVAAQLGQLGTSDAAPRVSRLSRDRP